MSTFDWPTTEVFRLGRHDLKVIDNLQRLHESPLSGAVQTQGMPGARWGWDITIPNQSSDARRQVESLLIKLSGRQHRVRLWDVKNPRPTGTVALTGVTVVAAAAQFATSLQLAGCGAGATINAGAWVGLATGQLVRVVDDATANGSGVATVEFRQMLRVAVASGSAVTLDKPMGLYVLSEPGLALPRSAQPWDPDFPISLVEVWP